MADRHHILNSWLEVFSPTVMGCLSADYTTFDFEKWKEWCRSSAHAGANGVRILPYSPWNHPSGVVPIERLWSPYRLDVVQKAWNLNLWNELYFATLGNMVAIAYEYKLKVWFSLFDNCQWHHGAGGITPWGNNVQGIDGYYGSLSHALRWVDKVHATLGKAINYEIINEGAPRQLSMVKAAEWIVAVFDRLVFKGILPENICWGPLPSSIYKDSIWHQDREHDLGQHILSITERRDRAQSNKVYRAMHGVGVGDEVKDGRTFPASYCGAWAVQWWGGAHSGKGFLSDDGVGNGGNTQDKLPSGKYQRPTAEQWYNAALEIFKADGGKRGKWAIERLPQNLDPAIQLPALRAISTAYRTAYSAWPENYDKFPPPQPEPIPVPEPIPGPPQPEPARPKITVQGWIALGLLAVGIIFCAILLIGG